MPREVRHLLRLSAGDRVVFVDEGAQVVIRSLRSVDDVSKRPRGRLGTLPSAKK
jgi:bifunctional DNA-binding transcriptional regulator/antitoxin component of YhaV-PrlF toxin-antitoxin module